MNKWLVFGIFEVTEWHILKPNEGQAAEGVQENATDPNHFLNLFELSSMHLEFEALHSY